ncbi:MAG: hypothetical protein KUG81_00220 [Gammaproteobacteria bacterium]|nr:hypothetical protein [Gammaproteobacteria bacterium]
MLSDLRKNYWVSQLASESLGLQPEMGCEETEKGSLLKRIVVNQGVSQFDFMAFGLKKLSLRNGFSPFCRIYITTHNSLWFQNKAGCPLDGIWLNCATV